jgi:Domain of unknown function (DUF4129)
VRSTLEACWAVVVAAALAAVSGLGAAAVPAGHSAGPAPLTRHAPDRHEIARAIEIVKADPNLATERTIRTLRWVGDSQPPPSATPASLEWLIQLIAWIAQSARTLVWVAAGLLIGLLAIYLIRLLRSRGASLEAAHSAAPTHVQDLDIRPESLPDNIGMAARALWDKGEHRAALSLLYRGLLSRLVHVHNVPIRDSSTEGDCLRLTASRLREAQRAYVTQLIRVWEHAVYGGREPEPASLYTLCDEFSPSLDAA